MSLLFAFFLSHLHFVFVMLDEEGRKIQVRIKPVEESKGSNSDLSEDQLKKLSATLTLMSPSTVVSE